MSAFLRAPRQLSPDRRRYCTHLSALTNAAILTCAEGWCIADNRNVVPAVKAMENRGGGEYRRRNRWWYSPSKVMMRAADRSHRRTASMDVVDEGSKSDVEDKR